MTAVSFSADDLAALGHLIAVGQAVLQKRPPVVARLKAAMTRMAFHSQKVSWRFGRQGWALVSANNADFDAAAPSHRHLSWLSICDLWECDFPYCPLHRVHYTALPLRGVLAQFKAKQKSRSCSQGEPCGQGSPCQVVQRTVCQDQSTSVRALINRLVPRMKNASRVVNETLVAGALPLSCPVGKCSNKRPVHQKVDEV